MKLIGVSSITIEFNGLKLTQFWSQSVPVMTDAMEMEFFFLTQVGVFTFTPITV